MKALKPFGFGVLAACWFYQLPAQSIPDSAIHLNEVVIETSRLDAYALAHYVVRVDSTVQQLAAFGTVADMMRKNGFGHIRSYGVGGVTTPSFRGTGAGHTSVLWNGINLQSPLHGQSDFTHLPVSFVDDIQLQSGGTASLYGSGAVGGTVHLRSRAAFGQGLQLSAAGSAASFGSYFYGGNALWSGKRFISSTRIFGVSAHNNFTYTNRYVNPPIEQRRVHAGMVQYGLLQQNYWQVAPAHRVSFRFWFQDNDFEVPNPTTVARIGEAVQRDAFYRVQAGWTFTRIRYHLANQISFVKHDLTYRDPVIPLASVSIFHSWINNLEGELHFSRKLSVSGGIQSIYEKGVVDEYRQTTPTRLRNALFAAGKVTFASRWIAVLSARQEFIDDVVAPFVPSFSAEFYPTTHLNVFFNTSKTYRLPTFNDLHWQGSGSSGNPNLQPESGWSQEVGFTFDQTRVSARGALFSNLVNDWILWTPLARGWSPENIKQVWARGVETNIQIKNKVGQLNVDVGLLYSFTQSTNREVYAVSQQAELGKQLAFTPQHEGSLTASLSLKRTSLNLLHTYTGKQFTDGDNSEYFALSGYQVLNLWLTQKFQATRTHCLLQFEVNNLLNAAYFARPGYPMPGRNFKLALTIQFHKPIKHEN